MDTMQDAVSDEELAIESAFTADAASVYQCCANCWTLRCSDCNRAFVGSSTMSEASDLSAVGLHASGLYRGRIADHDNLAGLLFSAGLATFAHDDFIPR
jgi:hypothetical protein